jgi:hypothetical protein
MNDRVTDLKTHLQHRSREFYKKLVRHYKPSDPPKHRVIL